MIAIRRSADRGHFDHGWLDTYHSFSFGDYYDPRQMGFRSLRVLNEDWVSPGQGFGKHGHRDMEIITVVLEGELAHRDSMGNGSAIRPGEVQRMSAGTGILHSEMNPSETDSVHLFQVWLFPESEGLTPSYEQRSFDPDASRGQLRLLASRDGRDGSVIIHQDARLYDARLEIDESVGYELDRGRHAWLQVARGTVSLNGSELNAGDGAAVSDVQSLAIEAHSPAEILLFDLA